MTRIRILASAISGLLIAASAQAEIRNVTGPMPYASTAEIYSPGGLPGTPAGDEIEAAGYVEEEYFVSGLGDVYASGEGKPRLEKSGLPYTTRILVIRPRDPARFNGIVHLTGIHPHQGGVQWNWASQLVLGSGAAYVAVNTGTDEGSRSRSTPDAPVATPWIMRWFDSERYAPISWPDDDGIRWSVFADTAKLLRAKDRKILADVDIKRVYSSGWSFLGSFQRTYINEGFHDLFRQADGKPLIDGYMIGISSPWQNSGYLPINARSPAPPLGHPRRMLRPIDVPVIELLSQNEAQANNGKQAESRDRGPGRHRLYEVGGTSHRDLGVSIERSYQRQLAERGHPAIRPDAACSFDETDVPLRMLFTATMDNLDRWVTEGTPPPPSAQLEFDVSQHVAHDAFGNPKGGVRSVALDLPLARYGAPAARQCATYVPQYLLMRKNPLAAADLKRLYPGGKSDYLARADRRIGQMLAQRWLRESDAALYRAQVRAAADKAFAP
ncbi:alpha/beta hydrolase domain-containing protein [Massilia niastensis]|uniref:alpha/beta hydrolase domain-containing protein n=1 Tax=Massilia niastensis TaxID=544911 RepID=UPI00036EC05C|nr:alpha/beta hydrolase domain-containing protein [Massilia niastensis]